MMEKIYTVDEIAEYLDLDGATVRKYFRDGIFKGGFKIGYGWRLGESDLKKWIEKKKNNS
jgi:excisionase family DNA binding protein